MINGEPVVQICCAMFERAAELVAEKKPTSQALRQAAQEMRDYARKNEGRPIRNIKL